MAKAIKANSCFDHPTAQGLPNSPMRDVLLDHGKSPSSPERIRQL
jgi:hypothetical protein